MSAPALRILIVNTHSVLNSGDASIVLSQVRWLEKAAPGAEISLTSRTARADRGLYGPMGLRVIPALYDVPSLFIGGAAKWKGSPILWACGAHVTLLRNGSDMVEAPAMAFLK